MLRIRILDPGSGAFLTPGSGFRDPGWVKSQNPDPDEQPGSYFRDLRNPFFGLQYLNSLMRIRDPGSWMEKFGSGIRDGKTSDPWSGISIPDPQHWWAENVRGRGKGNHKTNQLRSQQTKINQRKKPGRVVQTFGRGSMGSLPCSTIVRSRGNSAGGLHWGGPP